MKIDRCNRDSWYRSPGLPTVRLDTRGWNMLHIDQNHIGERAAYHGLDSPTVEQWKRHILILVFRLTLLTTAIHHSFQLASTATSFLAVACIIRLGNLTE